MPFWHSRINEHAEPNLRLVVGLGNPGAKYEHTRHNVGFMVAERMAQQLNLRFKGSKQRADLARGTLNGIPLMIALPLTYMNDSGIAVSRLVSYYHIALGNLVVVCDDIDLPFGTFRLRPRGSSGGNGGLKSIIHSLGTEDFARLRLGVGRPPGGTVSHVLGAFSQEEKRIIPDLIESATDAIMAVFQEGIEPAMNKFNRDWLPESSA